MSDKRTVRVDWTTTVEEYHTAEIPADEWGEMEKRGSTADDLVRYEGEESLSSQAVKERVVEDWDDGREGEE